MTIYELCRVHVQRKIEINLKKKKKKKMMDARLDFIEIHGVEFY